MTKKSKSAKPASQSATQKPSEDGVTYSNVPDSDGGMYHVSEVIKVTLPAGTYDHKIECWNSGNSQNAWAIDSMLIDEEMLYLEDEEADAMYLQLKQRSVRRRNMEEKENRLNSAMNQDDA